MLLRAGPSSSAGANGRPDTLASLLRALAGVLRLYPALFLDESLRYDVLGAFMGHLAAHEVGAARRPFLCSLGPASGAKDPPLILLGLPACAAALCAVLKLPQAGWRLHGPPHAKPAAIRHPCPALPSCTLARMCRRCSRRPACLWPTWMCSPHWRRGRRARVPCTSR